MTDTSSRVTWLKLGLQTVCSSRVTWLKLGLQTVWPPMLWPSLMLDPYKFLDSGMFNLDQTERNIYCRLGAGAGHIAATLTSPKFPQSTGGKIFHKSPLDTGNIGQSDTGIICSAVQFCSAKHVMRNLFLWSETGTECPGPGEHGMTIRLSSSRPPTIERISQLQQDWEKR